MKYAISALALTLWLAGCATTDDAEETEDELPFGMSMDELDEPIDCISMRRIGTTEPIGKKMVIFKGAQEGDPDYINILPGACPGLKAHRPIVFNRQQTALCHTDRIEQYDASRPNALMHLIYACSLGKFYAIPKGAPITDDPEE